MKTANSQKSFDSFEEPKSWCFCGHLGDGINSQHAGVNGHGRCEVEGCDCDQFTWKRFTNRFREWYEAGR